MRHSRNHPLARPARLRARDSLDVPNDGASRSRRRGHLRRATASRSACGVSASSISRAASSRSSTKTASICVVFNGEIYNYQELHAAARATRPHVPHRRATPRRSSTSTRSTARGCVDHLRGMFAFAIWDIRQQAAAAGPRSPRASSRSTTRKRTSGDRVRVGAEADSGAARRRSHGELAGAQSSVHVPGDAGVAKHHQRHQEARAGAPGGGRARIVAAHRALLGRRIRARRDLHRRAS